MANRKQRMVSRRRFLKMAAVGAAGAVILPRLNVLSAAPGSANGKLNLASIGVGGMGHGDCRNFGNNPNVNLVALCDVDEEHLNKAGNEFKNARRYVDWRELLAKEEKNIDAINIATPDHMHAPIAMTAIGLRKHVYCQKPLAHELHEVRQMTLAAKKQGVVTQMGIQSHSSIGYRAAVQMVQDGAIGKVREVHIWTPFLKWFFENWGKGPGEDNKPLTANFHWDLWLGVRPERPFVHNRYHPMRWRDWRDFGNGALGDLACHMMDPVVMALALDLQAPVTVTGHNDGFNGERYPLWDKVEYVFPGTQYTTDKTLKITWYDGERGPDPALIPLDPGHERPINSAALIGETGTMLLPLHEPAQFVPIEKFKTYKRPKLPGHDHYAQWVAACRGTDKASAPFDYSGPLSEIVLLGVLAYRFPGQALEWDAASGSVKNFADANKYLRREYRKGWEVEGL